MTSHRLLSRRDYLTQACVMCASAMGASSVMSQIQKEELPVLKEDKKEEKPIQKEPKKTKKRISAADLFSLLAEV